MTDKLREAAQAARDAMRMAQRSHGEILLTYPPLDSWVHHRVDLRLNDAIKAVEDALAEPAIKEYLIAQRPWVGLTDDEIEDLPKDPTWRQILRAAEAKLREKNNV